MEPTEHNLRAWEEAHRRPAAGGPADAGLPDPVKRSLASLSGKRVLHLQCGTGDATLELAALGAVVTGVDPSEAALDEARGRMPSIVWVHADPAALPAELRRSRFDLVYAGEGVTALARTGLTVRALEEYPARTTGLRRQDSRLPGEFLLHAVKPSA